MTRSVIEQFTDIVKRALHQFLNEQINERLQSAIKKGEPVDDINDNDDEVLANRIVTTEEVLEGFFTVKSIVREVIAPDRITHRDTINYMSVILDDSNRKAVCRLYFNSSQKYIVLLNSERWSPPHFSLII